LYVYRWPRKKAPRLLEEIAALQGLQKRDITRMYNKIRSLSKTDTAIKALVKNKSVYSGNEKEMLPRWCGLLGLEKMQKMALENAAKEILEKIHSLGDLAGRQPGTLGGVALYLGGQKLKMDPPLDLMEVGRVVGKTAQTIVSAAKRLGNMDFLLSDSKSPGNNSGNGIGSGNGNGNGNGQELNGLASSSSSSSASSAIIEPHPLSVQAVVSSSILPPVATSSGDDVELLPDHELPSTVMSNQYEYNTDLL